MNKKMWFIPLYTAMQDIVPLDNSVHLSAHAYEEQSPESRSQETIKALISISICGKMKTNKYDIISKFKSLKNQLKNQRFI